MLIELTDHLRCPQDHQEAFLVLLPSRMRDRRVEAGHLGCPVCGWSVDWEEGVPDFGGGSRSEGAPHFDAEGAAALLGIDGPGGWLALGGRAGAIANALSDLLPGVQLVAINPPADVAGSDAVSVVLSAVWPIKSHAMRGVVLGADVAEWFPAALASTLPQLRVVGEGPPPPSVTPMASAGGVWVVQASSE